LPFEQYQKDGRIVRGIQRGAQSFTARTALAALEITTRIIYLLQVSIKQKLNLKNIHSFYKSFPRLPLKLLTIWFHRGHPCVD
jgi:hypothetical protein